MKKSAFTLIELLVVISIIAILAAIALPALSSAIERGRAASDANNLHQLGIGILTYLNDNEDTMFSQTSTSSWPTLLQAKYVTDWRAFRSPFDRRQDSNTPPIPLSYALNNYLFTPTGNTNQSPGATTYNGTTSQFESPSELIMAATDPDLTQKLSFSHTVVENLAINTPSPSPKYGTYSARNLVNVLYADWHTAGLSWITFADGSSNPSGLRRWHPLGDQGANNKTGGGGS